MPTRFWPSTGQTSDDGQTCGHGRNQIQNESMSSAEDFRARMLARLEAEQESVESDLGFMWKCLERSEIYDLRSQSLKTSLGFSQTDLPPCCVILTSAGTMRNGKLYPRAPLVLHIHENECSLWPTPTATDYKGCSDGWHKNDGKPSYLRAATHPNDGNGSSYPHPSFVEALMGFPQGWTELDVSETQSFHRSRSGLEDS